MAKVNGLIRRGGTYSLRRRVPTDLVEAVGRKEIWLALGTSDYREACDAAREESAKLDRSWKRLRMALARGEEVATGCKPTEGELRRTVLAKFWRDEQSAGALDPDGEEGLDRDIGGLRAKDPSSEAALLVQARSLISESKLKIPVPADAKIGTRAQPFTASPELLRLLELLRRSDIEHLKRALDRLDGSHGDQEFDPLFAGINSVSPPPTASQAITLGEAIERFGSDPTRAHLGDTADAKYVMTFRAMKEVIGDDRPLSSVTRADCAAVQEIVAGLPRNVKKLKAYDRCKSLGEIVALASQRADPLMSRGTVKVYTHTLSSFFNWAIGKGFLTANPATRMVPARTAPDVSRRPFTVDELNRIVAGLPDWSQNGARSARYWAPLIAIFSGMRLGEIVSLGVDDVAERDGVTCVVLRKTAEKSLKTAGSERVIPVHPELVRLGLLQRVAKLRDAKQQRLFPDLEGGTQDAIADQFQKRFAYFQKKILRIEEKGVSFHSFRHGFRDALREAGVPIDATRALGGWARSGGIEERYGQGTRPSTLARWMKDVSYPGLILANLTEPL